MTVDSRALTETHGKTQAGKTAVKCDACHARGRVFIPMCDPVETVHSTRRNSWTVNAKLLGMSAAAGLLLAGSAVAIDVPSRISIADEDTSIYVIESNLQTLGFDGARVTNQRGGVFDVAAMWEGQPLNLMVDARRERVIATPVAMSRGDGEMPMRVALFGDNTATGNVERELRLIGYDAVEATDKRGTVFDVSALWNDNAVRLRVDADLGRIEHVVEADASSHRPSRVGFTDEDTTPYVVMNRLRDVGYTDIAMQEQKGAVFYGTARWNGQMYDLRIDARTGQIAAL